MSEKDYNQQREHKAGKAILKFLKKFKALLIILILAAIGICIFLNYRKKQEQMAAMTQGAQIETAQIETRDLTTSITTTGTVKSMESRVIKSALTKTDLSEVDVEVGDTVEAGQVVAVFKDEDIRTDIARIEDKISVIRLRQINADEYHRGTGPSDGGRLYTGR